MFPDCVGWGFRWAQLDGSSLFCNVKDLSAGVFWGPRHSHVWCLGWNGSKAGVSETGDQSTSGWPPMWPALPQARRPQSNRTSSMAVRTLRASILVNMTEATWPPLSLLQTSHSITFPTLTWSKQSQTFWCRWEGEEKAHLGGRRGSAPFLNLQITSEDLNLKERAALPFWVSQEGTPVGGRWAVSSPTWAL